MFCKFIAPPPYPVPPSPKLPPAIVKLGMLPWNKLGIIGLKGVVFNVPERFPAVAAAVTVLGFFFLIDLPNLFLLNPTNAALCGLIDFTPVTCKFFLLKLPNAVTLGVAPPIKFGVTPPGPNNGNFNIGNDSPKLPTCVIAPLIVSIVSFNESIIPGKLFMFSILILELFKLITL